MKKIQFRAMGCRMTALCASDSSQAVELLGQVPVWFEMWEQSLSRFRPDSELNWLNGHAGQEVQVSSTLWQVLMVALRAARQSDGLITPAILPLLEAAGYDRSFERIAAREVLPGPAPQGAVWDEIAYDARVQSIFLPPGMQLDLGGVAKGWAAHQAAQRLAVAGAALVNAGGDLAISAPLPGERPWRVGIDDPLQPGTDRFTLHVPAGGVATSGRDYRRWQQNGVWQHHIIDPRYGAPAQTDVLTASVVAPTVMAAEMAAKVVLILGSRAGLAWLEERPELAGLAILEDGTALSSRRWAGYL